MKLIFFVLIEEKPLHCVTTLFFRVLLRGRDSVAKILRDMHPLKLLHRLERLYTVKNEKMRILML